jgi:hypothetical protein
MKKVKIIKVKPIRPHRDSDRDGIPNWLDCKPYDRYQQGAVTEALKKYGKKAIERGKERYTEYKKERARTKNWEYIIYKQGDRWYDAGPFPPDQVQTQYNKISKYRNVTSVRRSKRKMAGLLNAQEVIEKRAARMGEEVKQYQKPRRQTTRTPLPTISRPFMTVPTPTRRTVLYKPPVLRF